MVNRSDLESPTWRPFSLPCFLALLAAIVVSPAVTQPPERPTLGETRHDPFRDMRTTAIIGLLLIALVNMIDADMHRAKSADLVLAKGAIGCIDKKETLALMALNRVGHEYKESGVSGHVVDYLRHVNGVSCANLASVQVRLIGRDRNPCQVRIIEWNDGGPDVGGVGGDDSASPSPLWWTQCDKFEK